MKQSFTLRLTLRFVVLVTLTTALVLAVGGWLLQRQAIAQLRDLHAVEGEELREMLGDRLLPAEEVRRRIVVDADSDAALFFIQVRERDGNIVFRSTNLGKALLPALRGQGKNWETQLSEAGNILISDFESGPWRIQVASRLEPLERLLRSYAGVSGLLLVGVAMLSVVLGYQFSRATLEPVRAIEATARRIRADNLSERIPVAAGHGELTALIQLLNDTFDRLQRSFEQVQRFTADASHELKTPLALARLNAEKLQEQLQHDFKASELLAEVLDEIARLNRIIESLLFLAKTEGGALQLPKREIDAAEFCRDFAEDATALAEDAGVKFQLERNEGGRIFGDPGLLRQLLLNVVTNAIAASPPGATVTFASYRAEGRREWEIVDEGNGLPEEQLVRIFERFTRYSDGSNRTSQSGNGLGLAICRGIAELHGGEIFAENRDGHRGLRVKFKFRELGA